jgi:branched-chain amino acid transport system permease protein
MAVTIWSGLTLGAVYVLVSLGFTLSLLPSAVFNFAQGAIVVGGTFLVYAFLHSAGWALIPALIVNIFIGAGLGIACELLTVRPLRWRGRSGGQQNELVTTVGMSTAIVGLIGIKWGYNPLLVPFHGPQTSVKFLGIIASPVEIVLVAMAIVFAVVLHTWFHATRYGQACLAVAEDREAATLRGINVNVLSLGGFAAAGVLGTVSAFAIGPVTYAIPTLANTIALGGFVSIALGGQGSFLGSLYGGLLVGLVSSFATRYIGANYSDLAVLALLLATLLVRPTGLGAAAEARSV